MLRAFLLLTELLQGTEGTTAFPTEHLAPSPNCRASWAQTMADTDELPAGRRLLSPPAHSRSVPTGCGLVGLQPATSHSSCPIPLRDKLRGDPSAETGNEHFQEHNWFSLRGHNPAQAGGSAEPLAGQPNAIQQMNHGRSLKATISLLSGTMAAPGGGEAGSC